MVVATNFNVVRRVIILLKNDVEGGYIYHFHLFMVHSVTNNVEIQETRMEEKRVDNEVRSMDA